MASLAALRFNAGRISRLGNVIPATSSIHTTAVRRGLKENDHSQSTHLYPAEIWTGLIILDRDDLPNHYEAEKAAHLKRTKDGTAKWSENLASNSEADV